MSNLPTLNKPSLDLEGKLLMSNGPPMTGSLRGERACSGLSMLVLGCLQGVEIERMMNGISMVFFRFSCPKYFRRNRRIFTSKIYVKYRVFGAKNDIIA